MIGVDTFSWFKILRLLEDQKWNPLLDEILDSANLFITHEGKKEFDHFFPDKTSLLENVQILPVIKTNYFQECLIDGFDENDASLLEYAKIKNFIIVTEDIPMLTIGSLENRRMIQFSEYILSLAKENILSNREFYHIIKLLRKWGNITKKKEKLLLLKRK